MKTNYHLYYSEKTSYSDICHYSSKTTLELLENHWVQLLSSLQNKTISAAIIVKQEMCLETGTLTSEVVRHIKRPLPKTLEINKKEGIVNKASNNMAGNNSWVSITDLMGGFAQNQTQTTMEF